MQWVIGSFVDERTVYFNGVFMLTRTQQFMVFMKDF